MSETETETETEEELVPVRITDSSIAVGDYEKSLGHSISMTRAVLWVRHTSLLDNVPLKPQEEAAVANCFDEVPGFETFKEETENTYGRNALEILKDERTLDVYRELGGFDEFHTVHLHAAIKNMTVEEAAEDVDMKSQLLVSTDGGAVAVRARPGGVRVTQATIKMDGKEYSQNLKTFKPDLDWVFNNWGTVGNKRYKATKRRRNATKNYLQEITDLEIRPAKGEVEKVFVNANRDSVTVHNIASTNEAIVHDDDDEYVTGCGHRSQREARVLEVDMGSVKDEHKCGTCYPDS